MTGIKTGDPVILENANGLGVADLTDGMKGWAVNVQTLPVDVGGKMDTLVIFMPEDDKHMYYISASRLSVDEGLKAAGLELNENTISKE